MWKREKIFLTQAILLKCLYLFNRAFAVIISQNGYQILFVTSSNGWWPDPTPQKRPVPTLKCWTQLIHNIWIRLKQALLQNTEIWTLYNLLRVIIGTCINIALVILLLYLVLENCVFYVTMKKETIWKSNTGFAIFEIVLDF